MLAVFLSPIYLLFQAYILLWLYAWADSCSPALHSPFFRIPVTVIYLFFAISPLTGFLITREPFHHFLRVISNYWLGTLEYILLFILVFDVVRRITGHSFFMKYRYPAMLHTMPKNLVIFGGFAIALILSVSVYGVLHARRVYVRHDPVVIEKSSSLPGLRIALIADLHLGYNSTKSHVRTIVDDINREHVDLVCIAGDLFDNDYDAIRDPDGVADILSGLKSRYGTYACWGNHDVAERLFSGFSTKKLENTQRSGQMERFVCDSGIIMLEDEARLIDDSFYVIGRKDYENAGDGTHERMSLTGLMADIDTDKLVISLEHEPRFLKQNADAGVDVMLCGHTHDGQFFPLNIAIRTAWENPAGLKKVGGMTSVVTSGVGVYGPDMRIGTDADISVVDIHFTR